MRLQGDILPDGALIAAIAKSGRDLCAKTDRGPRIFPTGGVLETPAEPPQLELLMPVPAVEA